MDQCPHPFVRMLADRLSCICGCAGQLTQPGWNTHPTVQQYAKLVETGRKKFKDPLLVLGGSEDAIIAHSSLQPTVNDTCTMLKQGGWNKSLEFVTYENMNHFPLIQASSMRRLQWAKNRLSDEPAPAKGCVQSLATGFQTQFTVQTAGPNFLVEAASAQAPWQYAL